MKHDKNEDSVIDYFGLRRAQRENILGMRPLVFWILLGAVIGELFRFIF